jgi:hypothetical protein
MGRFNSTGAGYVPLDASSAAAQAATLVPVETALRAFAAGATLPGGLPGKTWTNQVALQAVFDRNGTNPSPDVYWSMLPGAGTQAPATVGTIAVGTLEGGDIAMDPVIVAAKAGVMDLTAVSGAYAPYAGVLQAFRSSGALTGYAFAARQIPFVYLAPAGTAPAGGWPLVIFQHELSSQKEAVAALAPTLTALGMSAIALDLPLHGALALPGNTTGAQWAADFLAAPLGIRTNFQQAAFNLDRLEMTLATGGFASLGAAMPAPAGACFVGHGFGGSIGALYLAGNTTLAATVPPYSQASLDGDMKGLFSAPGGDLAYLLQASPAFGPAMDTALAGMGVATGTPAYNQFFQVLQSLLDPVDPVSLTTPLASGLPSRLSGRLCIQEATGGDMVVPNAFTRAFGNALGGRGVLGGAGNAVAPGFFQLGYGTADRIPAPFLFAVAGPKAEPAALTPAATGPGEGYFQFDQPGVTHDFLLDPADPDILLGQTQLAYFLGITGTALVVDPTVVKLP